MNKIELNEAASKVFAKYNERTGEMIVTANDEEYFFVNITREKAEKFIAGLTSFKNTGTGWKMFNAFRRDNAKNEQEISNAELKELSKKYRRMVDDDLYDKDLKNTYPELN